MSNPFVHLGLFLWAVLDHFFILLAGCVVTVLVALFERHTLQRKISVKVEIAILLAFVFFACFQAWRDQYIKVKSIPQTPLVVTTPPIIIPPAQVVVESAPAPKVESPLGYLLAENVIPDFTHINDRKNFAVTVTLENKTTVLVEQVVTMGMLAVGKVSDEHEVQRLFSKSLKDANIHRDIHSGMNFGPNQRPLLIRLETPQLPESRVANVLNGTERLYILAWAQWRDQNGHSGHLKECWWASKLDPVRPSDMLINGCEATK